MTAQLGAHSAGLTDDEAAELSIGAMTEFLKSIDAYKKLSEFGVKEEHVDRLAEGATSIMKVVLNKNPIVPDLEQVESMDVMRGEESETLALLDLFGNESGTLFALPGYGLCQIALAHQQKV